jgi:hypothetical protein
LAAVRRSEHKSAVVAFPRPMAPSVLAQLAAGAVPMKMVAAAWNRTEADSVVRSSESQQRSILSTATPGVKYN